MVNWEDTPEMKRAVEMTQRRTDFIVAVIRTRKDKQGEGKGCCQAGE